MLGKVLRCPTRCVVEVFMAETGAYESSRGGGPLREHGSGEGGRVVKSDVENFKMASASGMPVVSQERFSGKKN